MVVVGLGVVEMELVGLGVVFIAFVVGMVVVEHV